MVCTNKVQNSCLSLFFQYLLADRHILIAVKYKGTSIHTWVVAKEGVVWAKICWNWKNRYQQGYSFYESLTICLYMYLMKNKITYTQHQDTHPLYDFSILSCI